MSALDHHPNKAEKKKGNEQMNNKPPPMHSLLLPDGIEVTKAAGFKKADELSITNRVITGATTTHHQRAKPEFWPSEEGK